MALKTIHAHLKRVSRLAAAAGGLGIILIAVMITLDVLVRKFLGTTLGGATEMAGFIFAVATAMSYPYVLLDRANVRIDVIYTNIGPRTRAFLDLVAMLVFLYFVALLTNSVSLLLQNSWMGNSMSVGLVNIPLWIPQLLWVLGYLLLTLTAAFLLVYAIVGFVRRDWATVIRVAGVPNIEEQIEEETHIEIAHPTTDANSTNDEEGR